MRFRHYKGGFYELIALAKEEANPGNLLAVYKAERDGTVWTRPICEFFERVDHEGESGPRFSVAEPDEGPHTAASHHLDI
jgi:hypothetical protein